MKTLTKLTKKQRREIRDSIALLIGENYSAQEIILKLKLHPQQYAALVAEIYEDYSHQFENTSKNVAYSDYLLRMRSLIKAHHNARKMFKERGLGGPLVQSLKAEKEIYDSIIDKGQDFGILERVKKGEGVKGPSTQTNNFILTDLPNGEIQKRLEEQMRSLAALNSPATDIIDIRPELVKEAGLNRHGLAAHVPKQVSKEAKNKKKKYVSLKKS